MSAAPSRRRLLGKLLLVAGLGLAAALGLPELPREQPLIFDLRGDHALVWLRVELSREGHPQPTRGFELPLRGTRQRLRHVVELPHGRYHVTAHVRDARGRETSVSRLVSLQGDEVTLRLNAEP